LPADATPAELSQLVVSYTTLASQIDSKQIRSGDQLLLATQAAYLGVFSSPRLAAWQAWLTPVHSWINDQQTAKRLATITWRLREVYRTLAGSSPRPPAATPVKDKDHESAKTRNCPARRQLPAGGPATWRGRR